MVHGCYYRPEVANLHPLRQRTQKKKIEVFVCVRDPRKGSEIILNDGDILEAWGSVTLSLARQLVFF